MSRYDAGVAKPVQAFLSDWLVLCRTEKKLTLGFLVINELEFEMVHYTGSCIGHLILDHKFVRYKEVYVNGVQLSKWPYKEILFFVCF